MTTSNPRRRELALIAIPMSRGSPDAKLAILAFISPRGVGLASVMVGGANGRSPPSVADRSRSCGGGLADPIRGSLPPRVSTGPVVIRVLPVNCITGLVINQVTLSIQVSHGIFMGVLVNWASRVWRAISWAWYSAGQWGRIEWRA